MPKTTLDVDYIRIQFLPLSVGKMEATLTANPKILEWRDELQGNILAHAAAHAEKDRVIFLLDNYPNLNNRPNDCTLMHYAANAGRLEIVEYLFEKFPDTINQLSKKILPPVFFAVRSGNIKVFEFFTKNCPAILNLIEYNKIHDGNILLSGILSGSEEMVEHLLMTYPVEMAELWAQGRDGRSLDKCASRHNCKIKPTETLYKMFDNIFEKKSKTPEEEKLLTAFESTKLKDYFDTRPKVASTFKITKISASFAANTPITAALIQSFLEILKANTGFFQSSWLNGQLEQLQKYLNKTDPNQDQGAVLQTLCVVVKRFKKIQGQKLDKYAPDDDKEYCEKRIIDALEVLIDAKAGNTNMDEKAQKQNLTEQYIEQYYAYHSIMHPELNLELSSSTVISSWISTLHAHEKKDVEKYMSLPYTIN